MKLAHGASEISDESLRLPDVTLAVSEDTLLINEIPLSFEIGSERHISSGPEENFGEKSIGVDKSMQWWEKEIELGISPMLVSRSFSENELQTLGKETSKQSKLEIAPGNGKTHSPGKFSNGKTHSIGTGDVSLLLSNAPSVNECELNESPPSLPVNEAVGDWLSSCSPPEPRKARRGSKLGKFFRGIFGGKSKSLC